MCHATEVREFLDKNINFFFQDTAAGSATAGAIILIGIMVFILVMKKRFVIL